MQKLNEIQSKELLAACELLNDKYLRKQLEHNKPLQVQLWSSFELREDFEHYQNGRLIFRIPFSQYDLRLNDSKKVPFRKSQPEQQASKAEFVEPSYVDGLKPNVRGKGKKPAKKVTSIALDDDLIQALNERAEREERTVSALIRLAIKHYLECVK